MTQGNLLGVVSRGRHRYFQLQSPDIAMAMETLMVVAGQQPRRSTTRPHSPEREARSCYDHLAGRLGVELFDSLSANGHLGFTDGQVMLTPSGEELMNHIGIQTEALRRRRRMFVSPCLDWSERRYHLGGAVGAAILDHCLESGWLRRQPDSRAVTLSVTGRREFGRVFGVSF